MNNEFDNNQPNEYNNTDHAADSSNSEVNTADTNLNQSSVQNFDQNYYSDNYYSYGSGNQTGAQMNNQNPYMAYSNIQPEQGKKPKKKRKIFGVFKLTAAALAFGLVAGAAFQGYYLIVKPDTNSTGENGTSNIQITQVAQSDKGDTIVPAGTSSDGVVTDVSDVVEKVMPSIVAINADANQSGYDFFGNEYTQPVQASGSGIIIGQNDSKLLIATNNHVIDGATSVEIVFSDETKASAEIKGADANSDLAVLSVDMSALSEKTASTIKVATLGDSGKVKAGDMAIAIGNALGYGQSVTVGYISAVDREVTINEQTMTLLQTDAAINPGNSGGALLNSQGQVIGINSVKYASEEVEGMGYAIPISSAIPMINELINRQVVTAGQQGYLGIDASTAQDVTELYAERFNIPIGVYVNDVLKDSPAEKAGLTKGDIITGIDEVSIKTVDDLKNTLNYKKAGQKVELKIQVKENGSYVEKTLQITLGKKN